MFDELSQELLDLTVTEKGYRGAMYASNEDTPPGCSSLCCSFVLCCFLCHLCW